MPVENFWWSYWYFHFPNYAFALLFWTLIGRFIFGIFLPPDSPNYVYRWFRRLTDWLMRPVGFITLPIIRLSCWYRRGLLGRDGADRFLHDAVCGRTSSASWRNNCEDA